LMDCVVGCVNVHRDCPLVLNWPLSGMSHREHKEKTICAQWALCSLWPASINDTAPSSVEAAWRPQPSLDLTGRITMWVPAERGRVASTAGTFGLSPATSGFQGASPWASQQGR
jgi:hypothetical protein